MRVASLALLVLIASAADAQARCADDMKRVGQKVERTQKTNPSPQTVAAAKELKRYDERAMSGDADEVDCYKTIARSTHRHQPTLGLSLGQPWARSVNEQNPLRSRRRRNSRSSPR
jgi:hypothetical protein